MSIFFYKAHRSCTSGTMLQAPLSGARCMHRGRQYRCPAHDASRSNCIARARPSGRQWCQLGLPIYTVARCRARTQAFSSLTSEVQGDDSSHIDTADNVTQAEGAQTNGAAVAWDNTTTPTEDWSESKAFTLKDLDWGALLSSAVCCVHRWHSHSGHVPPQRLAGGESTCLS